MEHRWGKRVAVDIPIRLTATNPFWVRNGRLKDLSVSGGLISAECDLRLLSRIQVVFDSPRSKHDAPTVAAYVVRKGLAGVGVEWCEFSPSAVVKLLKAVAAHPYAPIGRVEHAAAHKKSAFGHRS